MSLYELSLITEPSTHLSSAAFHFVEEVADPAIPRLENCNGPASRLVRGHSRRAIQYASETLGKPEQFGESSDAGMKPLRVTKTGRLLNFL